MIAATQSNHPLAAVSASQGTETPIERALTRIRQAQMRVTKPRVAIIEALQKHTGPITIDRIHQDIGDAVCDLVTVYRCLTAFEDIGLVRRTYQHTGTCLYELTVDKPRHYHLVCKSCHQTERIDHLAIDGLEKTLGARGYTQLSHVLEFFGVCPACQQKAPARETSPVIPTA